MFLFDILHMIVSLRFYLKMYPFVLETCNAMFFKNDIGITTHDYIIKILMEFHSLIFKYSLLKPFFQYFNYEVK